jgi:hypothetical protein
MVEARKTVLDLGGVVKNMRVSDIALEFDLYVQDEKALNGSLGQLAQKISRVLTTRPLDANDEQPKLPKEEVLREVKQLFNEQRYWECHETLEQIWRNETGEEKTLQQGIILAASALVHYQRDEPNICISILRRALEKLKVHSKKMYFSIDIGKLKIKSKQIVESGKIELFTI